MSEIPPTPDLLIGRAVQRLRMQAGMSQAELAERMRDRGWKWVQPTAWSVEQGKRPVRLAEAVDLAAVLGTEVVDLLADPLEGAVRELGALLSEAEAEHSRVLLRVEALRTQRAALQDIQRATNGEQISFGPDPSARARAAFDGFTDDRISSLLLHLGAAPSAVDAVLKVRERERGHQAAGDAFGGALWAALTDAVPTLHGS